MTSDFKDISKKIFLFSFLIFFLFVKIIPYFYSDRRLNITGTLVCITVSQHTGTHTHTHTTYTSLLHQEPLQQRAPALAQGPGQQRDSLCAFQCHHHHSSSTFMANQDGLEHKNNPSLTLSKYSHD